MTVENFQKGLNIIVLTHVRACISPYDTSLSIHAADIVLILDLRAADLAALRSALQRPWPDQP